MRQEDIYKTRAFLLTDAEIAERHKRLGLDEKIEQANFLLQQAIKKHGNKIICGYSGGKDSKVILHLARQIEPTLVAVHNSHPEEKCDLKQGVVIIKEPKSNFAEYLKVVDVVAQIDGTRVAEEGKSVIWDGKEIERSEMALKGTLNPNGVFGLEIYYPILYWSDKDIWDYIERYKLMTMYEAHTYIPSRPYRGAEANPMAKPQPPADRVLREGHDPIPPPKNDYDKGYA